MLSSLLYNPLLEVIPCTIKQEEKMKAYIFESNKQTALIQRWYGDLCRKSNGVHKKTLELNLAWM